MTVVFAAAFGFAVPNLIAQIVIFMIVYTILKKKAFGPILAMLEQRKQRIADGEAKLEKITTDLAAAEKNAQDIRNKADADAARMVKEADDAAKALKETKAQEAIHEANQIMAKAREAAALEKEQLRSQLKSEFGRLISDATARVTGKVLNADDQARISQESAAQVSA
jgi:F-type H+-transporting ATPase subunit b